MEDRASKTGVRKERAAWRVSLEVLAASLCAVAGCAPVVPSHEVQVEAAPRESAALPAPAKRADDPPAAGDRAARAPERVEQTPPAEPADFGPLPRRPPLPSAAPPKEVPEGLEDGVVFGLRVYGLHPAMLSRLQHAEQRLASTSSASSEASEAPNWGVETISGYRKGSRAHEQGLAVDINYYANPYVMHESGDETLDAELGPVYHRVARLMLERDSVIPERITEGSPSEGRALRLYAQLDEESRAMVSYFRLMRDRTELERFLDSRRRAADSSSALLEAVLTDPVTMQRQMLADYVSLTGREGPPVDGATYPPPDLTAGDRPFAGDPVYRGPEFGLMSLTQEVVEALLEAGLRWGGTDMGNRSGDLMHFYLPQTALASEPRAEAAQEKALEAMPPAPPKPSPAKPTVESTLKPELPSKRGTATAPAPAKACKALLRE